MKSKFVSTPIYYASGNPHIGHAYTSVLADAISRYSKVWLKEETFFLTGLDEHGQKIFEKAKSENLDVLDFVEQFNLSFKKLYKDLNVDYSRFIRTTDPDHEEVVKLVWNKFVESGDLYEKEYEGMYCVGCESFKTDKDLNEEGCCPDHLIKPIILKEKNWFFKLSKYSDYLTNLIESEELKIIPGHRKLEMLNFIKEGLVDISFSRSKKAVSWGIPVPNDDTQTIYVWCDALVNYISACNYGGLNPNNSNNFTELWEKGNTLHLLGKDILRFHALYWPAMLKSLGVSSPKEILVHGLIKVGGTKMGKSLGNGVTPDEILNEYSFTNATEVFRYFFLKNINPHSDGDFTWERLKELYNADLANGLGNLVSRTIKLSEKYLQTKTEFAKVNLEADHKEFFEAMKVYDVMSAMNYIWKKIAECDLYMQTEQPFKTVKVDEGKGKEQLDYLRENLYTIARLLNPFMPTTSQEIKKIIKDNKMPEKPLFPRFE